MTMAATFPGERTQHARNIAQKAMTVDHGQGIGDLSRIVDRDIEILKMNLQLYDGRDEARSSAWQRLESAWEAVRSELPDDGAIPPMAGDVSPGNGAAIATDEVDAPVPVVPTGPSALRSLQSRIAGVFGPAISSRIRPVVRWSREPARRAELRAAAFRFRSFVSSAALQGAKRLR